MEESDQPGGVDFLVEALLCDLEAGPAWRKLRDRYETGWRRTLVYDRASVEEISPAIDLYWAMRIGFADGMLESTQAPLPARPAGAATDLPPDLQTLKDMVGYGNVRLIRLERVTEQLFPPAREAIEQCLRERLGDLWDDLPSDVTDPLISAEYGYGFGWQRFISTGAVLKGFHEAVKACFEWYFARPFAAYLNERRVTRTPVCWGVWQGQPQSDEFFTNKPWCLSLGKWAGALGLVAGGRHPPKNNPQLAAFLGHGWPDLGKDALRQLAGSLRSVQAYRNRWEHSDSPPRPYHTERTELDEMRDLVLGTPKSPSVICRIYDLLGRSKQS
jgi:hypothetical protein